MTSINDFATTYMCQSLPFGGVKDSGFDRFAGVEGLRGLCVPKVGDEPMLYKWLLITFGNLFCDAQCSLFILASQKAVAEDMWPFSTAIPPLLQYPVSAKAFDFCQALVWMFYAPDISGNFKGLLSLAACFIPLPQFLTQKQKAKSA